MANEPIKGAKTSEAMLNFQQAQILTARERTDRSDRAPRCPARRSRASA
jgi:hypothetical protein